MPSPSQRSDEPRMENRMYKDCDARYGSWSYAPDMVCPSNGTTCPDDIPHRVHGECANVFGKRVLNLMCGLVETLTSMLPSTVTGTILFDWFAKKPASPRLEFTSTASGSTRSASAAARIGTPNAPPPSPVISEGRDTAAEGTEYALVSARRCLLSKCHF